MNPYLNDPSKHSNARYWRSISGRSYRSRVLSTDMSHLKSLSAFLHIDARHDALLLYSRDSAGPVARIEFGNSAAEGPDCYARIQQSDTLVIVPADAARHLATLLLLAGTS